MEQEIDLKELLLVIRKRIWILIALPLIALVVSGLVSFYVLQPSYEASTTVIVGDNKAAQAVQGIEYNDVMANKQLVSTYSEIAKSRTVLESVRTNLKLNQTVDQLKDQVKVQLLKDTELIQITATSEVPKEAAAIADAVARVFCTKIVEIKKVDNVSILDPAVVPEQAVGPKKALNMAIALVVGVMAALGIIFLIEFLDDTIKTKEEATGCLGLAVLGSIPKFNSKEQKQLEEQQVATHRLMAYHLPRSPISEAFRMVRTNLQYTSIDHEVKSLVITSAGQGEGKSTIVANLAIAFAQTGKRVMLIDCDLRKPTQHNVFALDNGWGVTSVLMDAKSVDEAKHTFTENLDVLTSGPLPPNPAEVLGSKAFEHMLTKLKADYDLVLIDAPPAAVVTDAVILATMVDGALIALYSGKVEKEGALKVVEALKAVNARILGTVLNYISLGQKQYHNYYQYYYAAEEPQVTVPIVGTTKQQRQEVAS